MAPTDGVDAEPTPSGVDTSRTIAVQRRIDAAKLVAVKVLKELAATLEKEVRAPVEEALEPGEHLNAVMPDGTRIGKVALSEVPEVVTITDERALLKWVQEFRPDEIVPTIRESFMNHLKDQVKKHGYAFDIDGVTIPGIELGTGTPRLTPTPNDEGRTIVRAWLKELTTPTGPLALPPAKDAA